MWIQFLVLIFTYLLFEPSDGSTVLAVIWALVAAAWTYFVATEIERGQVLLQSLNDRISDRVGGYPLLVTQTCSGLLFTVAPTEV